MYNYSEIFESFKIDSNEILFTNILNIFLKESGGATCSLFELNILNNSFKLHSSTDPNFQYQNISFVALFNILSIDKLDKFKKPFYLKDNNDLYIPILKPSNKNSCIVGYIYIKNCKSLEIAEIIDNTSIVFVKSLSSQYISKILKFVNSKTDFTKQLNDSLDDFISSISQATSFPLIALRSFDEENGNLELEGAFGFDKIVPPSFTSQNIPTPFIESINLHIPIQEYFNKFQQEFDVLLNEDITNFIILPVYVREKPWGILSMATRCNFFLSDIELNVFQTMANSVGSTIDNYYNYVNSQDQLSELATNAVIITGLEIAQAVRHEAAQLVDDINGKLYKLQSKEYDKLKKDTYTYISNRIIDLSTALNKIKLASRPPKKEYSEINLRTIWLDAYNILKGKFVDLAINFKCSEELNTNIIGCADWLRNAFLNLLLNSCDAFKVKGKGRKEIIISREISKENSTKIVIAYSDNAGGIDFSRLAIPESLTHEIINDPNRLIFEKNVSSKGENGTGYGLYLARRIIQKDHNGSINIINHRGGVSYIIELSKLRTS